MASRETEEQPAVAQPLSAVCQHLAAVAELLPGSCHEVNNALTSIIGISDFLLDDAAATAREELTALKQTADRDARVIGNLQTLARTRPETRRLVDVEDLVRAALDLRAYELKAGGIEVVSRFTNGLPPVLAAENRLRLVFLSIIVNAEHAIDESRAGGNLTVTTESGEGRVRVAIADDGPGFAETDRARLFEPFFTTRDAEGGSGIGLSIARTIVADHGGSIDAESVPGGGAVFVVDLPAAGRES